MSITPRAVLDVAGESDKWAVGVIAECVLQKAHEVLRYRSISEFSPKLVQAIVALTSTFTHDVLARFDLRMEPSERLMFSGLPAVLRSKDTYCICGLHIIQHEVGRLARKSLFWTCTLSDRLAEPFVTIVASVGTFLLSCRRRS